MTHLLRNNLLLLPGIVFCFYSHGQSFKNKTALDPVSKAGFYSIAVTPALSSDVKTDFSDLRITDEKMNPVPYLLKSNIPLLRPDYFKSYKIISNTLSDSGETVLVIENAAAEKINGFSLRIKNAIVSRSMNISGSDDQRHWFSIAENIDLGKRYSPDSVSYIENIGFPLSSYHYYRIIIYNGKNDPLNIIAAGRYVSADMNAGFAVVKNPNMKHTRNDSSDHISYINILNPEHFHINHIYLTIRGPKFFKRRLDIVSGYRTLGNFIISSAPDSIFHFVLPVFNDSNFLVKIYNDDNPVIGVVDISTAQDAEKIVAYLEPGKNYELQMTDEKATAPRYDLEDFKDSIPAEIPALKFSNIEPVVVATVIKDNNIFKQAWLWPVMIAVLIVLILFTFRLTKDMAKKS